MGAEGVFFTFLDTLTWFLYHCYADDTQLYLLFSSH